MQDLRPAADSARSWPQSIREFEALVDELQHRLVQFAFCRLHSREDAEDVVQDVLVQAYRDREKHRAVDNAAPFLFRMVANRCTDVLRRRKRDAGPPQDLAAPHAGAEPADGAARMRRVEELLGRIPRRQAEVIRLRVYAELPFEAVAEAMDCSVPTAKSRFRYGVQKLRRALKRQGGGR
jgi:RNA polymerase sigma-70 factor (ECF subfamily)